MEKREEVRITPAVHKFMSVFLVLFFFFFFLMCLKFLTAVLVLLVYRYLY